MKTSVIIMAGGIGERLWPLSREKKPKQFLKIIDNKSLIEQTIDSLANYRRRKYFHNNRKKI